MARIVKAELGDGTLLLEGDDLSLEEIRAAVTDPQQATGVVVIDDAGKKFRPFRFEGETYPVVNGVVQL